MDHANPLDTSTNHSTLLKAISWLAMVTSFFFISIRTGMKWANTKTLGLDDLCILLSFLLSVAASVCLTIATNQGFGDQDATPDAAGVVLIEKLIFAFNILFFWSLGSSMLSITDLIFHISPVQRHRLIALGTGIGIGLWTLVATFGFAFQCMPNGISFLTTGQCINRSAFYTFIALSNLILESSLVLQPTILTWALNMSLSRRITVIICFLGRILVVVLLIAEVAVIWNRDESQDLLMDFGFVLITILILNVSIVVACTPYLRPFFISLHTTQMDITELPHLKTSHISTKSGNSSGIRSGPRSPMYSNGKQSKRSSRVWQPSAQDLASDKDWKFERLNPSTLAGRLRPDNTGKRSTIITTNQIPENEQDSMGSIEHTIEFSVEVETIPKTER